MSWQGGQLKHWLKRNDSGVWGADPSGNGDTEVLRSTDIALDGSWDIHYPALRDISALDRGRKRLEEGDLVVVTSSGSEAHLGKTAIVDREVAARKPCFANFVQRLTPSDRADARYVRYLLSSRKASEQMATLGNTTTGLRNLNGTVIGAVHFPGAPLEEQRAIADYLDTETARIDALITKKRQLITLLETRWVSFLDQALSMGESVRVRHVTSLRTSGSRGWSELVGPVGPPFVRSANLRRDSIAVNAMNLVSVNAPATPEAQRSRIEAGDCLVGITGANTGWVAVVPENLAGGFVSQHVALLRPAAIEPEWLAYSIFRRQSQDQLLGGQYGGTKTQLSLQDLAELTINAPSRDRQRSLVASLSAADRERLSLRRALNNQVALLSEHRHALITAAVTGDFKVPGAPA